MHTARVVHRFGPFTLNPARRHLFKGDEPVPLPARPTDILLCLVANAGRIVDKETLTRAAWPDTAVSDDSLRQAVNAVRRSVGCQDDGSEYIETRFGRGYRFTAPVERIEEQPSIESVDALLDAFRTFADGRAALESFDREHLATALEAFETMVRLDASLPEAHIGLATACLLAFEATRVDPSPDAAQLARAERHAREACRLNPSLGSAWGRFALVRHRSGASRDALAAAQRAVTLDRKHWLQHVRLAAVSWGDDRLRAAHQALEWNPDLALAHWLAATVLVARQLFDRALEEVRPGCALQDARRTDANGRYPGAGLHWLHGLLLAATGDVDRAVTELERELATTDARHVYGRELMANTWYAIGALRLRQGRRDEARAASHEASMHVPGHVMATVVSVGIDGTPSVRESAPPAGADAVIATAVALALRQQHEESARICGLALAHAAPGSVGWLLPVEPILNVTVHPDAWTSTLATLRARAL